MKKLSILITALLITLAASAQITDKTQIPEVTQDQRCIMIDADGNFDVYDKINNELASASEAIQGDVLIITTQCEVYNKFLSDFYSQSPYSNDCVILFLDYVKNTYLITSAGDIKNYEEDINASFEAALQTLSDDSSDDEFFEAFIESVVENCAIGGRTSTSEGHKAAAVDLPDDNWGKYSIGQRTEQNPLVFKSFLQGKLTAEQLRLALETPYVDTAVKVYDAAGLLTDSEISKLQSRIHQFIDKYNVDMVVVTINHNNKTNMNGELPSDNFAMDFYEYNDFGKGVQAKEGYDGVILLIDMQYRKFRILDVGVPNDKWGVARYNVDKYVENMAPDLTAQNYYNAINYFIGAYESDYEYEISFPWIKCSLFALILGFILLSVEKRKYKNIRKATSAANYVKQGSFRLTVNKDTFVSTHTTKTYDPPQKSSGGGGSHGGSSGRSFGGGGGSF
ncbi:MAG: TPM domain-containing protein [Bacteroidales bacterium]|nr:TPM domain-containing protein [Bacteroidales bacterium]